MPEIFSETIVQLILYFAVLAILTGIAFYISGRVRANSLQQEQSEQKVEEQLKYFRDLNFEGKLSNEEFRIIKKQLSAQIIEAERMRRRDPDRPDFQPDLQEMKIDRHAIIANAKALAAKQQDEFAVNNEDTQIIGKNEFESDQDTVVGL